MATVIQANWEFFRWALDDDLPHPDVFWSPSTWELGRWPVGTRLVPFPVDTSQFVWRQRGEGEQVVFLHVEGWPTRLDRNGKQIVERALRIGRRRLRVVLRSQGEFTLSRRDPFARTARHIDAVRAHEDVESPVELFSEGDVLLLPRRFGGQSLVANEAVASGLAVVMPDFAPNEEWPHIGIGPGPVNTVRMICGDVAVCTPSPHELARTMERLADDAATVQKLSLAGREWAAGRSWEAMLPVYRRELETVAQGMPARRGC